MLRSSARDRPGGCPESPFDEGIDDRIDKARRKYKDSIEQIECFVRLRISDENG
jgi:hypothetical protein